MASRDLAAIRRMMQDEMINRPPPSGGFLQWWSNDQTFFNEVGARDLTTISPRSHRDLP